VAGFTRKTGVFFAYGVDGPEFPSALYAWVSSSSLDDALTTVIPSSHAVHVRTLFYMMPRPESFAGGRKPAAQQSGFVGSFIRFWQVRTSTSQPNFGDAF